MRDDPYSIIYNFHHTEQSSEMAGRPSPQLAFIVKPTANKCEIAQALSQIYADRAWTILAVNTSRIKPKPKRGRRKGRPGRTALRKKAIVTLASGAQLEGLLA